MCVCSARPPISVQNHIYPLLCFDVIKSQRMSSIHRRFKVHNFQVQIFRMYLSLALSPRRTLNGRLAVWACGRCAEAAAAPPHVAAAARAAAAQTLRAYCTQLGMYFRYGAGEGKCL